MACKNVKNGTETGNALARGRQPSPMPHDVLISDTKSAVVDDELQGEVLADYDATVRSTITETEDELLAELDGAEGLIVDAGVPVTREVLERAEALEVVGRAGIGVDNVDLEAAREEGITVVNHPTYSLDEVATHALSLLLASLRRLPVYDRSTRSGEWEWSAGAPIPRLQGSTIGLLGFGKIPKRLATMIGGFGCEVLAADPHLADDEIKLHNVEPVEFDDLLSRADLLSIHTPLTEETEGMLGEDEFERLSDEAVVVNTARGPVIDTDALVAALETDEIGFAGLDVTEPEPLPDDHALYDLENAVVTPHVGWYSEDSRAQLSREIAADVGRVLAGEEPEHEVDADSPWV